jgi:hypothetical protein
MVSLVPGRVKKNFLLFCLCIELIVLFLFGSAIVRQKYPELEYNIAHAVIILPDCFIGGTQILMADGTSKSIEDVQIGNLILSYNLTTHTLEPQPVLLTTTNTHNEYMVITFTNGVTNTNTIQQPYYVKGKGWASYDPLGTLKKFKLVVGKLEVGDTVFFYEEDLLKEVMVESIVKHDGYIRTYNLHHINATNTYFANGVLVHNKAPGGGGGWGESHPRPDCFPDCERPDDPDLPDPANCLDGLCPLGLNAYYPDVTPLATDPCPGGFPCGIDLLGEHWTLEGCNGYGCFGKQLENGDGSTDELDNYLGPEVPPPEDFEGIITAVALQAEASVLTSCPNLKLIKTCLDAIAGGGPEPEGCSAVGGGKQYLDQTMFSINNIWERHQTGSTPMVWNGVPANYSWTLRSWYPPGTYEAFLICHKKTTDSSYTEGSTAHLDPNTTEEFLVGYVSWLPWFQIRGGNTYGDTVESLMPLVTNPNLYFDTESPYPGIFSTKTGMDLSSWYTGNGLAHISSTNWSTNNAQTAKDWYSFFKQRIMSVPKHEYTSGGDKPPMVAGETTSVYVKTGNVTTSDSWVVGSTDSLVIQVEGNLTIQDPITIQNGGFLAFIVSGDIQVSGDVGTTYSSVVPVLEGIYIAKGKIMTGTSLTLAKERLVARGVFIADNILSQRTLVTSVHNKDTSADLFIFNPNLVMNTPEMLMDIPYIWQEVAP